MGPAVDAFETALVSGTLRHPGNPCLDWNAANAIVVNDAAGNRKLDKSQATGRIDGLVAALMAMAIAAAAGANVQPEPTHQLFFV
jgi:phage terminase large subunit-like protein